MSDYKTIKYVETFDGDYGSLINTPTIPSAVSDLSNDTGFITSSSVPTAVSQLTNDSGYLTTAPAPTTAQVASATAGISAGAVGSYAALGNYYNSDAKNIGDTNAGSNMFPVNFNGGNNGAARSGTWRCMGYSASGDFSSRQTVWLRIS